MIPAKPTRISSNYFEYRRQAFPYIWFGGLGLFAARISLDMNRGNMVPFLAVTGFVALTGYGLVRFFNKDMVDVVWDDGKELVVEKDGEVTRVPISDILKVKYSRLIAPRRVTLILKKPGKLGNRIVFALRFSWWAGIREYAEVRDLVGRVEAARGAALVLGAPGDGEFG